MNKLTANEKAQNYEVVRQYISKINGHDQIQQELHAPIYVDIEFDNGVATRTLSANQVVFTYNNVWGDYIVFVDGLNRIYRYQEFSTEYQKFSIGPDNHLTIQLDENTAITLSQPR